MIPVKDNDPTGLVLLKKHLKQTDKFHKMAHLSLAPLMKNDAYSQNGTNEDSLDMSTTPARQASLWSQYII